MGYVPKPKTYPGREVPTPLKVRIMFGNTKPNQVLADIMALTKLNFNACLFGDGLPVTLRFADDIGEILTAGPDGGAKAPAFPALHLERQTKFSGGTFNVATNYQDQIERVSNEALEVLETIAAGAESQLGQPFSTGPSAVANMNTFTSTNAIKSLSSIDAAMRRSLEVLAREPAIARVVALNPDGKALIYYICRETPSTTAGSDKRLAGRNSPAGRLASLGVGDEFELRTPGGMQVLEIVEKAPLHPFRPGQAWDSRNSVLVGESYGPVTVVSMRDVLALKSTLQDDPTLLDSILAGDEQATIVIEGIRRSVIAKMGLRDQPILDRYQDEIFRLPLNSQLLIIGPPGTGKTTTLIRRLGQKVDREFLVEDEQRLVDINRFDNGPDHRDSWLMFTPTDLLKQYLKEAFARENIAAPDQKIATWSRFRLDLARNRFRILKTSAGGGPFVLRHGEAFLSADVMETQTAWYEDFFDSQNDDFWSDLDTSADLLRNTARTETSRLGLRLAQAIATARSTSLARTMVEVANVSADVERMLEGLKSETDAAIRKSLVVQVNRDKTFLDQFAAFLDGLSAPDEEQDDQEGDEDEDVQTPRTRSAAAALAYSGNLRSQARARASRRTLGRTSRAGRIAEWIGDRALAEAELRTIGESLQVQGALRKFAAPVRRYINGIPARYRRFRRARQAEGNWYASDSVPVSEASPLEVDLMLLCTLRAISELVGDRTIRRLIDSPAFSFVKDSQELFRDQIVVDEATDFSPVQLACMGALSNPGMRSFCACGDFNQRITAWGSRSTGDMQWAFPQIDIRPIQVTYRHSRQLNHLAKEIVRLCSGETVDVILPKDVDNDGVPPVLGTNLAEREDIVAWLADRIVEIERSIQPMPLPSVAVLVNDESEVGPLADSLQAALSDHNLNVVACYKGQFAGQENDIRVFDVQHIKGLEFEAVFFVGVDELANHRPELFDKYLYVGATRAATYLGLTCQGGVLPEKIKPLVKEFAFNW